MPNLCLAHDVLQALYFQVAQLFAFGNNSWSIIKRPPSTVLRAQRVFPESVLTEGVWGRTVSCQDILTPGP